MRTMRKIIIAVVIIFPLTFISGVIARKQYVRSLARFVAPCTVTKYRALYRTLRGTDTVNVRGFVYGGEVLYLADKDLKGCGDSVVGLEIPEDGKTAFESQALIRELRRLSGPEKVARAEFEVVGDLAERGRSGYASRYFIKVRQILPAGPLEVVDSADLAKELTGAR